VKRIRKSRAARILCWVTTFAMIFPTLMGMISPPAAQAQQTAPVAAGNPLTVIVVPFVNTDRNHTGGADLAQWATDAVAVEMAQSGRFEVIKPSDVTRQGTDLGYRTPYDQAQLSKIASALGANAIVSGEVAAVRTEGGKAGTTDVRTSLLVRVADASSGELMNGAAQIGTAAARPGENDVESLARDAASKAALQSVKEIVAYTLPEGIITNSVTDLGGTHVLINRGSRDGVKDGMDLLVLRSGNRVGRVRVTSVFADDAEGIVTENIQGIRPEDTVRATFPMPVLTNSGNFRTTSAHNNSGAVATLGKVLLVLIVGVAIATAAKQGGSVTGVTAEPDIQNFAPAVRLSWRDNLFGGGTLEYHIWRSPDAPFNYTGIPVRASTASVQQVYDYPSPFDYWNGVNSYLQPAAPNSGAGNGGGTGGTGTTGQGAAASVTPAAGSAPAGFIIGTSYTYQITAVVERQSASISGNNGQNGGGGGTGGTGTTGGTEDVETAPVTSGQSTPVNQPGLTAPASGMSSVNIRQLNFTWTSVIGADVFVVEVSSDRTFMNPSLILQLPQVFSTAPNAQGVAQTLSAPIDLTNNSLNGALRRNTAFNNFITSVPGAAVPTLWWRVGARNNEDRPGPVSFPDRVPSNSSRMWRYIYSTPQSFQPAPVPPPPPH